MPCDNATARQTAYAEWRQLACQDATEKRWIAQRIIERTTSDEFKNALMGDFDDFAPLLASQLDNPNDCPGLAGLDDSSKNRLRNAAKNE